VSILALDISFANTGWSVLKGGEVISYGTIRTEKSTKKTVRVSDDRAYRAAIMAEHLKKVIIDYGIKGVVAELPSGSQNAVAAALLSYANGVVVGLTTAFSIPCEWISEGDSKKSALGKRTATKDEMMDWARKEWPNTVFPTAKCHFEHVADSLAAYNGLKHGVLVRSFG
jgi:Holliday junction resolvasome RuvABC endonuclease subunit